MTVQSASRNVRAVGREAAASRWMEGLARAGSHKIIEALGTVGVAARGIVFGVLGVFLVVAAITFDAKNAQGIDGSLRKRSEVIS